MSVYGSQYNNSLRTNVTSGLKESFGGGKFHINGLLKGVGWGVAGAVVDAGFDVYENSLYDDTIKHFIRLGEINKKSKGINIIAKTK